MNTPEFDIGIIGGGFVGSATKLLNCPKINTLVWDLDESKRVPSNLKYSDILTTDFIFICVPTPMSVNGECHTGIVECVIQELKSHNYTGRIIVRSTVPVGFCHKHDVDFMPEFLTEANWKMDFYTCQEWIIGTDNFNTTVYEKFTRLFQVAKSQGCIISDMVTWLSTQEAESVKYFRNCFLATKVSFCNEFYNFCKASGVDYSSVAKVACNDPRIGQSHSRVPGPDGKTGFSGSCFPKDMASLCFQMKSQGLQCHVVEACITRNLLIDRPEKDWENQELKGRATL